MKVAIFVISVALVWSSSEASPWRPIRPPPPQPSTLRLVHTLFRHGNRNPEETTLWEANRFTNVSYYPEGFGQLTNKGKLTEYNLGKLLRQRYDSLLGDIWDIDVQEFKTTDVNRTKMSGLLVMAGLWPPKGRNVWSDELAWQPIPYNVESSTNSPLLYGLSCSSFYTNFAQVYASDEIQNYLSERYSDVLKIVEENTGVSSYASAGLSVNDVLKVQDDLGFPLDEWTQQVYPEPLNSLAVDIYRIMTNTTTLRQIAAGTLLKKIITDSQSLINGTLSPSTRKLFVYSAHDTNVAPTVLSLGYPIPKTVPYGSAVIFEVHEIDGVWGFKLFYNDWSDNSPLPVTLPGCDVFCPIDEFEALLQDILPTGDVCSGTVSTLSQNLDFLRHIYV